EQRRDRAGDRVDAAAEQRFADAGRTAEIDQTQFCRCGAKLRGLLLKQPLLLDDIERKIDQARLPADLELGRNVRGPNGRQMSYNKYRQESEHERPTATHRHVHWTFPSATTTLPPMTTFRTFPILSASAMTRSAIAPRASVPRSGA